MADATPAQADMLTDPADKNPPADGQPEAKPADKAKPSATAEQRSAAEKLARATAQFAQAQDATGQGAEQVSGQEEVANMPLREALELASGLTPESFEALPMESGDAPSGDAPAGETPASEQPAGDQPASEAGAPAEGTKPASGAPQKPTDLGKGLVPNSPKTTAQMMAGKEALEQLEQALGQPLGELLDQAGDMTEGSDPLLADGQQPPSDGLPQPAGQNPPGTPPRVKTRPVRIRRGMLNRRSRRSPTIRRNNRKTHKIRTPRTTRRPTNRARMENQRRIRAFVTGR